MYKVHEILIPVKFSTLILQVILSIVVAFTKVKSFLNYISQITYMQESPQARLLLLLFIPQLIHRNYIYFIKLLPIRITVCLIVLYVTQAVELIIIFTGMTIFLNKLSIIRKIIIKTNIEIFFHSIGVLLLAWFIWQQWIYTGIWMIWGIGGFIPMFFELCGIFYVRIHYRKVLKIS